MAGRLNRHYRTLGPNLQRVRERRKATQERLAEKLGVSPRTIQYYECGKKTPSLRTFVKLCDALRASLDDLFRPLTPAPRPKGLPFRRRAHRGPKR